MDKIHLSHIRARLDHHERHGAIKASDQRRTDTTYQQASAWLADHITAMVGTMTAALVFTGIALVGLPAVLGLSIVPGRFSSIVLWVSSEFLQLVLLAVILTSQNVQSAASDKRAQDTLDDTIAIQRATVELHALIQCIHSNPETGSCPGHPEFSIPPHPVHAIPTMSPRRNP